MPVIPIAFAIWMMSGRVRRVILRGLKEPETRGLIYATMIVLVAGTTFYRLVEGWRWVDSLYFSVVTLTTRAMAIWHRRQTQASCSPFSIFWSA